MPKLFYKKAIKPTSYKRSPGFRKNVLGRKGVSDIIGKGRVEKKNKSIYAAIRKHCAETGGTAGSMRKALGELYLDPHDGVSKKQAGQLAKELIPYGPKRIKFPGKEVSSTQRTFTSRREANTRRSALIKNIMNSNPANNTSSLPSTPVVPNRPSSGVITRGKSQLRRISPSQFYTNKRAA